MDTQVTNNATVASFLRLSADKFICLRVWGSVFWKLVSRTCMATFLFLFCLDFSISVKSNVWEQLNEDLLLCGFLLLYKSLLFHEKKRKKKKKKETGHPSRGLSRELPLENYDSVNLLTRIRVYVFNSSCPLSLALCPPPPALWPYPCPLTTLPLPLQAWNLETSVLEVNASSILKPFDMLATNTWQVLRNDTCLGKFLLDLGWIPSSKLMVVLDDNFKRRRE